MYNLVNKASKTLMAGVFVGALFTSCGDFGDLNVDPKSPLVVDPVFVVANAEKNLADHLATASVNINVSRLLTQYWSQVTYTNESRYDLQGRNIPESHWNAMYRDVIMELRSAADLIVDDNAARAANKDAILTIMEVYAFQMLVDMFGDVPYTDALGGAENRSPSYDDAATIYSDLVSRLNAAISAIDETEEGFGAELIYGGDMAAWARFGNSLKLRMGIRLADADPATAQTLIEQAAPNAFQSNADNAEFAYRSGSVEGNPNYSVLVLSGRHDYVISIPFLDALDGVSDPRIPYYMDPSPNSGLYEGAIYGNSASVVWSDYAQASSDISEPEFPSVYMDYAEVCFILAEAAERGWSTGGTAAEHYANGIEASVTWWGGTDVEAAAYSSSDAVRYDNQPDAMQAIAFQRWVAFYANPWQGYMEMRRMNYPSVDDILATPVGLAISDFPLRYPYPIREAAVNGDNYTNAGAAIGGDEVSTRIFWDMD